MDVLLLLRNGVFFFYSDFKNKNLGCYKPLCQNLFEWFKSKWILNIKFIIRYSNDIWNYKITREDKIK